MKAAGKLRAPVLGHTPAHEVGLDAAVTPGDLEQLAVELHIPTVGEPGLLERSIECDAVAVSLAVDQGAIDIEHNRFQDVVALGSRWSVHAAHSFPSRERHSILPTAPRVSLSGMRIPAELAAADRRHLWHPFTQQRSWESDEPPIVIDHAEGTTLCDIYGNAYIDGVSSLWCNVHGHREPAIDGAVKAQLDRVAHSTMLGLSHAPGIELAERLLAVAPPGLSRVFYSDSGSTAVEIALKMAFQWWAQRGETERTGFICLENAYHGDTVGAVSVGGALLDKVLLRRAEASYGIFVMRAYGSSEAPFSTTTPHTADLEDRLDLDGRPNSGVEVRIGSQADENECLIRGPHLFLGYLDPADNDGAFESDWFRTGDIGILRGDQLKIVGRLKEIVIRNGIKLSLHAVEEAALALPFVKDAAAFGRPDRDTGEHLALAVRPAEGVSLDLEMLVDALLERGITKRHLPEELIIWDEPFPKTVTEKLNRAALAEQSTSRSRQFASRLES